MGAKETWKLQIKATVFSSECFNSVITFYTYLYTFSLKRYVFKLGILRFSNHIQIIHSIYNFCKSVFCRFMFHICFTFHVSEWLDFVLFANAQHIMQKKLLSYKVMFFPCFWLSWCFYVHFIIANYWKSSVVVTQI